MRIALFILSSLLLTTGTITLKGGRILQAKLPNVNVPTVNVGTLGNTASTHASNTWNDLKQSLLTKICLFSLFFSFLGIIIWKVWEMNRDLNKSKTVLNELEDQIEVIDEEENNNEKFIKSIKDIREGIIFFENPCRASSTGEYKKKIEELDRKIRKLKEQEVRGKDDIMHLEMKHNELLAQLKELQDDYERRKKQNFDIGQALGLSQSVN